METIITIRKPGRSFFTFIIVLILAFLLLLYYQLKVVKATSDPLIQHLAHSIDTQASKSVFREAIQLTAKNLSEELGIDLKNYDITRADYEAIVSAAADKFGNCEQYRLFSASGGMYNCYSCLSKARIRLQANQTYKIGQTCGNQKSRYGSSLPEPGLMYVREVKSNIFVVLVAEYVKLSLFRFSKERQRMIKLNHLMETELLLPPANKILK